MGEFNLNKKLFLALFAIYFAVGVNALYSNNFDQQQQQYQYKYHHQQKNAPGFGMAWPVNLTYDDTKTNKLLGEELLKRLYARIAFTDNIIRAEVDTLFENVKDLLDKKLRRCERRRRRDGSGTASARTFNLDQYDPYQVNASLAHQYAPRKTRY